MRSSSRAYRPRTSVNSARAAPPRHADPAIPGPALFRASASSRCRRAISPLSWRGSLALMSAAAWSSSSLTACRSSGLSSGAAVARGRRLAAVVGAREREVLALEEADLRRPDPRIAGRKRRQRGDDLLALLLVGLVADPLLDRLAVLRRDHAHRDQRLDLGEAVLVKLRRPLRDQHDPQADAAAEADQVVGGVEHLARARIRDAALRREDVRLVDDQAQRAAVLAQQRLREGGEELPCARRRSSGACRSRPASSSSPRPRRPPRRARGRSARRHGARRRSRPDISTALPSARAAGPTRRPVGSITQTARRRRANPRRSPWPRCSCRCRSCRGRRRGARARRRKTHAVFLR
jgi:hypothetical protein